MTTRDEIPEAATAGARAYEDLLVPALTLEWVDPLLDAAHVGSGQRVLDVACGTGVVSRGALRRVGVGGVVVGVDPDPAMLAVAAELEPGVDWRVGVAGALPVENGAFDAVVSQFGLMFFPDPLAALREMHRASTDGGQVAVAVWDSIGEHPAYATEVRLLDEIGGSEAGDALRAPFLLGDANNVVALFEGAGFESVEADRRVGTARFPDIRTMVGADLHGWLPLMGVHLDERQIADILAAAEREMAHFVTGGEVVFDSPAHLISGRKPPIAGKPG